jgi:hypothetical protein
MNKEKELINIDDDIIDTLLNSRNKHKMEPGSAEDKRGAIKRAKISNSGDSERIQSKAQLIGRGKNVQGTGKENWSDYAKRKGERTEEGDVDSEFDEEEEEDEDEEEEEEEEEEGSDSNEREFSDIKQDGDGEDEFADLSEEKENFKEEGEGTERSSSNNNNRSSSSGSSGSNSRSSSSSSRSNSTSSRNNSSSSNSSSSEGRKFDINNINIDSFEINPRSIRRLIKKAKNGDTRDVDRKHQQAYLFLRAAYGDPKQYDPRRTRLENGIKDLRRIADAKPQYWNSTGIPGMSPTLRNAKPWIRREEAFVVRTQDTTRSVRKLIEEAIALTFGDDEESRTACRLALLQAHSGCDESIGNCVERHQELDDPDRARASRSDNRGFERLYDEKDNENMKEKNEEREQNDKLKRTAGKIFRRGSRRTFGNRSSSRRRGFSFNKGRNRNNNRSFRRRSSSGGSRFNSANNNTPNNTNSSSPRANRGYNKNKKGGGDQGEGREGRNRKR